VGGGRHGAGAEAELASVTWRRIAVQTAALFAVGVLALDALAVGVVLDIANRDAARTLDQAAHDPDAFNFPPMDVSVYLVTSNGVRSSAGATPGPVDPQGLVDPNGRDRTVTRGGHEYLVRSFRTDAGTTQIALDVSGQDRERHRLYLGLAAAGGAGMLLAGVLGALIARRAIAPLGQAIARQRRFVADASHELRTPLTQLHMRAQLIEQQLRSWPDAQTMRADVTQLVRGTRQMGEILDELLTAAQLGAAQHHREPVDVGALATSVADAEQVRAEQGGVQVTVEVAGDNLRVPGVPTALRRVLASLVDNALSHTPAGGQIMIGVARVGDQVRVQVRDTGTGFDPAMSEQIFERFHRGGHGDPRRFGLGLSLAHEVLTAHDGTIVAESAPGEGACFTIDLPAWQGGVVSTE
jgi:signal transduction histidine kinase